MKTLLFTLAFAASSMLVAEASDAEGLFVAHDERAIPKPELSNGEFVYRVKAVRLQLTRAVFRYDTEDKSQYWLEVEIGRTGAPRIPDPGDFYVFRIGGKDHAGFVIRGPAADGGWKWALGFTNPVAGRALLTGIAKAYSLPETHVQDRTREHDQNGAAKR